MTTKKYAVAVTLHGGKDSQHELVPRDTASNGFISANRSAAAGMVLNNTEAVFKTGCTVAAGNVVVTIPNNANIDNGMLAYGDGIPRTRRLTVVSSTPTTVTLSGAPYESAADAKVYFATSAQLFDANATNDGGRKLCFHFNMPHLADKFNVADTVPNALKIKAAMVVNIGPLRRKLVKNPVGGNLYNLLVPLEGGGTRAATSQDLPAQLTSHNDQQSTVQSNSPEGESRGFGGKIADTFLDEIQGDLNLPLASVSVSGNPVFSAGVVAQPFGISSAGLVRKFPAYDGGSFADLNSTASSALKQLLIDAAKLDPISFQNDFLDTVAKSSKTAIDYQDVLLNAQELTDPPAVVAADYIITNNHGGSDPSAFMRNLKQILRMIQANSPNRGGVATRVGDVVTIETEVSTGAVANRTAGQNKTTVTYPNHRLFTSTLLTANTSDSVLVTGADTSPPAAGYKITLEPTDVNNKFFFTSTDTGALVDAPVTVRLKHNLSTANKVYFDDVTDFDSSTPADGYPVASVVNPFTFTVETTATGAFTQNCKFKLINVPKMMLYVESAGMNWDTHTGTNDGSLKGLDVALNYYNSIAERLVDADVLTFCLTEFGRTINVNNTGTDHGWGNHWFVMGKSVNGNAIYGTFPSLDKDGNDVVSGVLLPTTSVYQYGATIAKWMGASDAEVLSTFPDLANWPIGERYLEFV